jgi:mono/diheme cytochrome c family protein
MVATSEKSWGLTERARDAILGLALLVATFACGGGEDTAAGAGAGGALAPGTTAEMVQQGEQLYGTVCVSCHGQGGVGTQLGPALNDAQWIDIDGEFSQIVNVIRAGVLQPRQFPSPMPPMDIDDFTNDQVRAMAAYVYSIGQRG